MTKQEFITELKSELEKNKVQKIQDILSDYEEHFVHGLNKNKSEFEIAKNLGSPATIAKAHQTENMIQEIKNPETKFRWGLTMNVIGRLLILAPLNFFMFIVPGVIIFTFIVTGWALAVSVVGVALSLLVVIPEMSMLASSMWLSMTGIFSVLGLLGFAAVSLLLMFIVSKYVLLALINYLQWNLKFITENRA
jgi:uncharacterized membrane protein